MSDPLTSHQIAIGKNIAQAWGENASANITVYEFAPPAPVDAETLAAARELLAKMPTDHVPVPTNLPPDSRMPYAINPHFVGRETELCDLARLLKADQTTVINQVVATGLGGIGKTQLATAFAQRYGQYFAGGVHWLSLADPTAVPAEVVQCGLRMNLRPDFGQLKLDEQVPVVLSAWQSDLPRLLIFDNCEDEELLARWRPPQGGCRVMITSRRRNWSRTLAVQPLPLSTLPRDKSVELLLNFLRDDLPAADIENPKSKIQNDLRAIAAELGDLPLALHLAGSFLTRYHRTVSPADYLTQLQAVNPLEHPALQGRGADWSPTQHDLHIHKTFDLGYQRLNPADPFDALARQLLARAACLAPGEPIPVDLLLATVEFEQEIGNNRPPFVFRYSQLDLDDALHRLTELGLLDRTRNKSVIVHRLLIAFVIQIESSLEPRQVVENTLLQWIPRGLNTEDYLHFILLLLPHLQFVTKTGRVDETTAQLYGWLGYVFMEISDYKEALIAIERSLAIREQVFGTEHSNTANSLNNLAEVFRLQGDYKKAKLFNEKALVIREKTLGLKHPATAKSLNDLGLVLQTEGDYVQAKSHYEHALAIREETLGRNHPETGQSLDSLGGLLKAQGNFVEACLYYERALAICISIWGPDHYTTAPTLNNLAGLLLAQGKFDKAKAYFEQSLAISESALGANHPEVAQVLNNLGVLACQQGNYKTAQSYHQRALSIREEVLGPEHPDTAQSICNLSGLFSTQGEHDTALSYLERALAIYQKIFGFSHPTTAEVLHNMATLYLKQKMYVESQEYFEQALVVQREVLGDHHPITISTLENLALLFKTQGDYKAAKPLIEQVVSFREKALGSDHPDTASSIMNLANIYTDLEEYDSALVNYEKVLSIFQKTIGPKHLDTAKCLNNLGILYRYRQEFKLARIYSEQAATLYEEMLGPDHPFTKDAEFNLYMSKHFNPS